MFKQDHLQAGCYTVQREQYKHEAHQPAAFSFKSVLKTTVLTFVYHFILPRYFTTFFYHIFTTFFTTLFYHIILPHQLTQLMFQKSKDCLTTKSQSRDIANIATILPACRQRQPKRETLRRDRRRLLLPHVYSVVLDSLPYTGGSGTLPPTLGRRSGGDWGGGLARIVYHQ